MDRAIPRAFSPPTRVVIFGGPWNPPGMSIWFPAVPKLASESAHMGKRPPSWTGLKMGLQLPLSHLLANHEGWFSSGSEKASVPLDPNSQEEVWAIVWEKSHKDLPFWMLSMRIKFQRTWSREAV